MGVGDKGPSEVTVRAVEIARTGHFTDMHGQKVDIDESYLDTVATNYDIAFHEAQLTTDHIDSGPSNGRIARVYRDGDRLLADIDTNLEFAQQMTIGGKWPSRSSEIYPDLDGRGPYLRNVTALGAAPPAIKAMRRVQPSQITPAHGVPAFAMSEGETGGQKVYRFTYTTLREGTMPDETNADVVRLAEEKAQAEIALKEAQTEAAKLKEQNAALLAEKEAQAKAIKLAEARSTADKAVLKFREARKVTPGMEEAGLPKLFALAELYPEPLKLGDEHIRLAELVSAIIDAIPPDKAPETGALKLGEAPPDKPADNGLTAGEIAFAEKLGYVAGTAEGDAYLKFMAECKAKKGGS